MTLLPRSLGGRTALVLILALMVVQASGLGIHALDRVDLQRLAQAREITARSFGVWRTAVLAPPAQRMRMIADLDLPDGLTAEIGETPTVTPGMPRPPINVLRLFRLEQLADGRPPPPPPDMDDHRPPPGMDDRRRPEIMGDPPRGRLPPPFARFAPREILIANNGPFGFLASLQLPDGDWVNLRVELPPPRPWHSDTFLAAFILMTCAAVLLILWAVNRLTRPVRVLAAAADRLGRDVNAPPLEEGGPTEIAKAAHAFNTMQGRIRRFVADRTQMLAAIGHDLRTPITRLRLRAEFLDDDEQRRKMLADLDEMEAMIAATLAFARDEAAHEPATALDLAALCRTVADEAVDAHPDIAERIGYAGPEHLVLRARPVALKRALSNLVRNALVYGGAARLSLGAEAGTVRLAIEDDGPGIPETEIENVFQPFRRLETSRNRETGGTGLGLPIARNIFRAHGGDVVLRNRAGAGLTAVATLPA
ncbi:ATP-binding protein [Plastoroseomonas arctica]|uniref:histidine kinase n=1 Tax=Plastoroseomonas arctica TaxID=1509237 RepID=A0AAF1KMQ4_9PROT|nr:ATP-binding protein [Plastoroseomonas arctica]MBR0655814.1 HAMP domain-containing protein [Plastoroseomonas arctica]